MSKIPSRADSQPVLALGMMSGTSMDGIDAALLRTDGETIVAPGAFLSRPYSAALRDRLRAVLGGVGEVAAVAHEITVAHASVVRDLLKEIGITPSKIKVIGFHGHTILHQPQAHRTWQIGDAAWLAADTGIDVVDDFRSRDVAGGGEGAPLAPLYHAALARDLPRPLAVLNVGGVANVTWIGEDGDLLAFDTGPGNALIDDWVRARCNMAMDVDGQVAHTGQVDNGILERLLENPYFDRLPPKSLDRLDFDLAGLDGLSAEDGAATLTTFTAAAVARGVGHIPAPPRRWLVTGGGRHNPTLIDALVEKLDADVAPVEAVGWDGDALEAQAFAYLAVRSLRGLPLSLPRTTGVAQPTAGGTMNPSATGARD